MTIKLDTQDELTSTPVKSERWMTTTFELLTRVSISDNHSINYLDEEDILECRYTMSDQLYIFRSSTGHGWYRVNSDGTRY
jgi:hypothetical protein